MGQHYGRWAYLVCDHNAADGHRCPNFFLPGNPSDPAGPGAVLIHRLDAQRQGRAAGWLVADDRAFCPRHAAPVRPAQIVDVPLFDMAQEVSR